MAFVIWRFSVELKLRLLRVLLQGLALVLVPKNS